MSQATLTPEAKSLLSTTVRALRTRLIDDLLEVAASEYRLNLPIDNANLDDTRSNRRKKLEEWIDEQRRAEKPRAKEKPDEARQRWLLDAVKTVASTWLNRIVLIKHLEAHKQLVPALVTGGWSSAAQKQLRSFGGQYLDPSTEGYGIVIQFLFDELSLDLPGLFGEIGLERLLPLPHPTLRELIETLDDKRLESAWTDDTTLGWVYQYWNDPEREALDKKIADGGKIEPSEIASKTQMFTERYMVEWLLQNSLGTLWLAICKKNRWTANAYQVLDSLDERRSDWRRRREAGEVALDALMPIEGELEEQWKYYVPQAITDDMVASAPDSIREVKILDPACGSGHFLIIAFDLLASFYREEAKHCNAEFPAQLIAEEILENNLFGVDIDPRSVQIAGAGLILKARDTAPSAHPAQLNLVASSLKLGNLSDADPATATLREALLQECGISRDASSGLMAALGGADHLGPLLRLDAGIDDTVKKAWTAYLESSQQSLPVVNVESAARESSDVPGARFYPPKPVGTRQDVLDKLVDFLAEHSTTDDLGLRLSAEQLRQGVRFARLIAPSDENKYHLVIGNPPYQATSKMAESSYLSSHYPNAKADLYAAFLERCPELVRPGGTVALLVMRGWMFLGQFKNLRSHLMQDFDVRVLGDVDRGAFDEVPNEVLAAVMVILRDSASRSATSIAIQPTHPQDKSYDRQRTNRKRAAVLAQVGRYEFDPRGFKAIDGEPVVYWWNKELLDEYETSPKLRDVAPAKNGLSTQDNIRFIRLPWEQRFSSLFLSETDGASPPKTCFVPYIKGAEGASWAEPVRCVLNWSDAALVLRVWLAHYQEGKPGGFFKNPEYYFRLGVAFSVIGSNFSARLHQKASVFGHRGSSVFGDDRAGLLCTLNARKSRNVMESLGPGIDFLASDVGKIPNIPIPGSTNIVSTTQSAFCAQEAAREASVEFRQPGPSPWRYAQAWAQRAVDRPSGEPLPAWEPEYDAPQPASFISFAFGVAIGRFGANGEGIIEKAENALPDGILFVSARAEESGKDSLDHAACARVKAAWEEYGPKVGGGELRTYLRKDYFMHVKETYENRPIYLPFSSKQRNFVAWMSIHRWEEKTERGSVNKLSLLLADHLVPERRAIESELAELAKARDLATGKQKAASEKRYAKLKNMADELDDFIALVAQCADKGPPQVDREPPREVAAAYVMDLDDGVMVNSAALWPLLDPQWKDPKKWWKELASASGRKDYDWSHLAARYFPTRVAEKCVGDPSLAVAHGCFWRLHPEKAYAWELRLQDEIAPEFTIVEVDSAEHRERFLSAEENAPKVAEIKAKEEQRRARKAAKQDDELPGLQDGGDDSGDEGEGEGQDE